MDYPFARCDSDVIQAVIARTSNSAFVICGYATEFAYYRGQRFSDGKGIELFDVVPTSDGFVVTNPSDGTRYEVRPSALTIVMPDGRRFSEPMVQYFYR